ncbi:serine carboxypeptidase-like 11 [Wolffia australiana]
MCLSLLWRERETRACRQFLFTVDALSVTPSTYAYFQVLIPPVLDLAPRVASYLRIILMEKFPSFFVSLLVVGWASGKKTIDYLPGYDGRLPFELEAGYVEVNELQNANLFYTFVKSERNPAEDPILLWLIGGPGCSGFGKFINGFGPFYAEFNFSDIGSQPVLRLEENSWTKFCSVIFVDSPVGSGFSYSNINGARVLRDTITSKHLDIFTRKWFVDHPEFLSNHFYVGGDSYGGKVAPIMIHDLITGNDAGMQPFINIKGFVVGNPITNDLPYDAGTLVEYSHGMGLISDEMFEETKKSCKGDYVTPRNAKCKECLDKLHRNIDRLDKGHILQAVGEMVCPKIEQYTKSDRYLLGVKGTRHFLEKNPYAGCEVDVQFPAKVWADSGPVREALGVRKEHAHEFHTCDLDLGDSYIIDISSAVPYYQKIMKRRLRALVYSGDYDQMANFRGTLAWIKTLNSSIIDDWEPWFVDNQVAGYKRTYANNLTFATVKGAGHVVSYTKLRENTALVRRWMAGKTI